MNMVIKFTKEWTKLRTPTGGIFTTIRRSYPSKSEYYRSHIGEVFDIMVNGKLYGNARLLAALRGPSDAVSGALLEYDTDGDAEWMKKIDRYGEVLILLFLKCDGQCS